MEKVIDYKTAKRTSSLLSREEVLSHIRENWSSCQSIDWLVGKKIDLSDSVQIIKHQFFLDCPKQAIIRIYDGVILWVSLWGKDKEYSTFPQIRVVGKPFSLPPFYNDLFWD